MACNPWTETWPVSVRDVVPVRVFGEWVLTDRDGRHAPLVADEDTSWKLAAVAGGRPVQVLGEWTRERVAPLGVWAEERMVVL